MVLILSRRGSSTNLVNVNVVIVVIVIVVIVVVVIIVVVNFNVVVILYQEIYFLGLTQKDKFAHGYGVTSCYIGSSVTQWENDSHERSCYFCFMIR